MICRWLVPVVASAHFERKRVVKGARYIVVEGPIGVGKTTLARLLAEEFSARPVLEQVEENPFLKKFYDEPGAYAFQTQLFFLLSRYRQQRQLAQQDLFNQSTVADYLFAKDQIFAQANLEARRAGALPAALRPARCPLAKARSRRISTSTGRGAHGAVAETRPRL